MQASLDGQGQQSQESCAAGGEHQADAATPQRGRAHPVRVDGPSPGSQGSEAAEDAPREATLPGSADTPAADTNVAGTETED